MYTDKYSVHIISFTIVSLQQHNNDKMKLHNKTACQYIDCGHVF